MVRFPGGSAAKRVVLEIVGWTLVVVGIAALVLPGPGLLMVFGGLAVLSQQYEWAERRVRPVEVRAKKAAAESVQTWPRIAVSVLIACWVLFTGVLWIADPDAPQWWPLDDHWWLLGGWPTGVTLVASAVIAFVLIVYSFRTYRGVDPDDVAREAEGAD
jgi:uncharacterized protein (TIGR02611 family)